MCLFSLVCSEVVDSCDVSTECEWHFGECPGSVFANVENYFALKLPFDHLFIDEDNYVSILLDLA